MDYSKMKSSIDRAILKSPLDVAAYDDKFALCRDYEGTEFRLAHEWNQALQEEIRAGLKLAVDTRDFKTAEEFDNPAGGFQCRPAGCRCPRSCWCSPAAKDRSTPARTAVRTPRGRRPSDGPAA